MPVRNSIVDEIANLKGLSEGYAIMHVDADYEWELVSSNNQLQQLMDSVKADQGPNFRIAQLAFLHQMQNCKEYLDEDASIHDLVALASSNILMHNARIMDLLKSDEVLRRSLEERFLTKKS